MTRLIEARTVFAAWQRAVESLQTQREDYDLIVDVAEPDEPSPEWEGRVDALLDAANHQPLRAVANTIFPAWLASSSTTRDELYRRYEALLPRLRKLPGNSHGTYFGRMINYPPMGINQVEHLITSIHRESTISGLRHAFEIVIVVPGLDKRPMGFPCLSSLSLHRERDSVRLAATYRNQFYFERALGNLIGLARFQAYVAEQASLRVGSLSMHAFHAKLDATGEQTAALLAIQE